jgi:hypothetical protein
VGPIIGTLRNTVYRSPCTTALIERVVLHAEIIAIEGESYRRREA